ncbi:hypothetical protein BDR07DRAFT_892304 [Suillus spraguei]|nr:hypothetical protein BDR07DRAFT_892304 [Suillus spraguei]
MATSASFHGLQNGNRYQIDKKSHWRYDGFIATPERDIRVNAFTFGANTASAEDGIYLLDARTTIGPIVDDEGKSAHSLHLFANDVCHFFTPFLPSFIYSYRTYNLFLMALVPFQQSS